MMGFGDAIINWFSVNKRDLPWRNTSDAFRIWLSEIILQQTRVAQGLPYYEAFTEAFPTVMDLAQAPENQVMKLWQGLGYYSRARNLHFAAKQIAVDYAGVFPSDYKDIKSLKGVGDYTAAAIASFAFGLPHAVVDGNVYRVLSRVFEIETPMDSTAGKKEFAALAHELLNKEQPALYNQAIMEFGALQCVPKSPNCISCCLEFMCLARKNNRVGELPIKAQKVKQRKRFFYYVVPEVAGDTLLQRRLNEKDIWQHLYQFPLIEVTDSLPEHLLADAIADLNLFDGEFVIEQVSGVRKHVLSHQILFAHFVSISASSWSSDLNGIYICIPKQDLGEFPIPRLIDLYLHDRNSLL